VDDRFLGGRVAVRQSADGFRSGLDAVMLAAAVPARAGDHVLELGAGAGAASLCLAARVAFCRVTAVEIDAALAGLVRENAQVNGAAVEAVCADIFALPPELKREYAHVFCNPPFHEGQASPDEARDRALRDEGRLGDWLELGLKRAVSGGTFTTIIRADRMGEALSLLPTRGVSVLPLWPRTDVPAKRVIIQAVKGARAALTMRPGLVLHESDGRYTQAADAILRGGAALTMERP
jgi:tRNA1Val (adenine37-N6)-methyltransferase